MIVPAIDLLGGKCVFLTRGKKDAATVYSDDPVAMARRWEAEGAQLLHVVDLDGAFSGTPVNRPVIRQLIDAVSTPVQVGGGLRGIADIDLSLSLGAARVVLGTAALEDRGFLEQALWDYPGRILVSLDAMKGKLMVRGWQEATGLEAIEFLRSLEAMPLGGIIYTDVARDGTMQGPDLELVREVTEASPYPVFASGGIASLDDVRRLSRVKGLAGMIIGKALYEGAISLTQAVELCGKGA